MQAVFLYRPTAESLDRLGAVKRFLLVWTPVLIGIAVIATESTATFSAANTSSWLRPIVERFVGPIGDAAWGEFHHLVRKSGHFLGYGTLCVLFLRAWLLSLARDISLGNRVWLVRSWVLAVASTFVVASADEFHQTFLPSRTGMFSDVVLDTCGGMAMTGIVLGLSWCLRRALSPELRRG